MKKIISTLISLFLITNIFAQQPDWIDFNTRRLRYPDREYLSTFLWNEIDKSENAAEKIEQLKLNASSELSSMVRVQIKSTTDLYTAEVNQQVNEYFRQASTSYTDLTLTGLKYLSYYDSKKNKIYVLAYVKKQELIAFYKGDLKQKLNELNDQIKTAQLYENNTDALKTYLNTKVTLTEIESIHSLLISLGINDEEDLFLNKYRNLKTKSQEGIIRFSNSNSKSIDELAYYIAHNLSNQIQDRSITVRLSYFAYQDTRMTSPFSKRLLLSFKNHLTNSEGLSVIDGGSNKNQQNTKGYILRGTYWEEGDKIRVSASITNLKSQRIIAAFDNVLSKTVLSNTGVQFKPENFEEAYARMKQFHQDEVMGGGMTAEVWTNHGDENLLYTENDTMTLYVRVNHLSYIRVIYYLADGTKVLLLDNYYIGKDKVNKVYEIPYQFVCAPPFGVESLQLLAQTNPFPKLTITEEYGYQFINDDTQTILQKSRGFKRVKNEDLKAESRLIITTMQ